MSAGSTRAGDCSMTALLLGITAAALLVTKALDVRSTWHHVGVGGESNPIVRRWFERYGLARGMVLACSVYIVVLGGQLGLVCWLDQPSLTAGTIVLGLFIAWAQWDVARFNKTGLHSWFTRRAMHIYMVWGRWMRRTFRR